MKYLDEFLQESASFGEKTEPAKPAKPAKGTFAGFAGTSPEPFACFEGEIKRSISSFSSSYIERYSLSYHVERLVSPPVEVAPGVTIVDVQRCIKATLVDLQSYVNAKNAGREHHWVENLVDEKLARLELCGVKAEIRTVQ